MTVRIIDRRLDSRNKSSINRSRFIHRFKGQIRKAVADAIARRGIRDLENGEKIGIPGRDISEPQFRIGQGGVRDIVHPGNDRFHRGDEVERPLGGGAGQGTGQASPDGEGMDDFVFTLTRDEFLDIFFDELALPNLVKRQLARIDDYKRVRAGYTQSGVPTNINLVRTMRGAAGRRIAVGGPHGTRLRHLLAELEAARQETPPDDEEIVRLEREIACLRARMEAIPFIDPFDLRYSNRIRIPQPSTQAVMFCLMDVSGSMDQPTKDMAKRFYILLYLFLTRTYKNVEVVYIRHHTQAKEVNEHDFFYSQETGGTIVSSALELMSEIMHNRYPASEWNIYAAQASDGDNWADDSPHCKELLAQQILPWVRYFSYIEITNRAHQSLWFQYEELAKAFPHFAMENIRSQEDIYPVFRELFKKRAA